MTTSTGCPDRAIKLHWIFFSGFFLKFRVYANKTRTVDALKANTRPEIAAIEPHVFNQVIENDQKRLLDFDLPGKAAADI